MKKGFLFLSLSAIALSMFVFKGANKVQNECFAEYGYDVLEGNGKVERLNALKDGEPEGANKDAGNSASKLSSMLGVQYGTNSKGQTCMRFAVAIPSLDVQVVFNRTLTKANGTVTYGQVVAKSAYESISMGDDVLLPSAWNNQYTGAEYNYFAVYTMTGIPESEYNSCIEVSAEVTLINEETNEEDNKQKAPGEDSDSAEVYNKASIADLKNGELLKFIQEIKIEGFDAELVDGKIVLTNYSGSDKNVIIPEGVTSIADGAFQNKGVKTVVLPSTIETIGEKAFYKTGVTTSRTVANDIQIFLDMTKTEVDDKVKSGEWDEDWKVAYTTSPLGWGWLTTDHDATVYYQDQWHFDENGIPTANK